MRIVRHASLPVALLLTVLAAGSAGAGDNPNGTVFRAVGWFKGKAEITQGRINCEIPNISNAISEGAFALGLWNTFGSQTIYYPDINGEFGNPCGGWIQLQNNLLNQAINLDRIKLEYRIPGVRRFTQFNVPARNQFPSACRTMKKMTLYIGNRLNPVNSTEDTSNSGAPNIAFIQLLPMVTPELFGCLRDNYAALPTTAFASLPLVIRATAFGVADSGDSYKSNAIQYTLNLRHLCGNGRVDDGEQCDPTTTFNACAGTCASGKCSQDDALTCVTDADCVGACTTPNNPTECACVYP